jgi:hypothetical protein
MPSDELMFAGGAIDITPQHPVPLFGFADRTGPFTHVAAPLEANLIILRHRDRTAVLVSVDTLFCSDELRDRLADVCREKGVPSAAILVGASHTHCAPACDPDKPQLGFVDPPYVNGVVRRLKSLLAQLLEEPGEPVAMRYGEALCAHAVNRRRLGWGTLPGKLLPRRRMLLAPNSRGHVDRTIRTLGLWDRRGQLRGCVWIYGCHPVAFPQRRAVHPEFPGIVRNRLRHRHGHHNLPVAFFQGFSGDVRPNHMQTTSLTGLAADTLRAPRAVRRHVCDWLNGASFITVSQEQFAAWTKSLATLVDKTICTNQSVPLAADLRGFAQSIPLSELIEGDVEGRTWSVGRLDLGGPLTLIAVSAEVAAEYTALLQRAVPHRQILPVSCVGSVFGYLPTNAMLREGGYEAIDHLPYFNISGRFNDHLEQTFLKQVCQRLFQEAEKCRVFTGLRREKLAFGAAAQLLTPASAAA